MKSEDLRISEAAKVVGVHPNTLRNYERNGRIQPGRDLNGHRRFTLSEMLELKELLAERHHAD